MKKKAHLVRTDCLIVAVLLSVLSGVCLAQQGTTYYDFQTGEYITIDGDTLNRIVTYSNGVSSFQPLNVHKRYRVPNPIGDSTLEWVEAIEVSFKTNPNIRYILKEWNYEGHSITCLDQHEKELNSYIPIGAADQFIKPNFKRIVWNIFPGKYASPDDACKLRVIPDKFDSLILIINIKQNTYNLAFHRELQGKSTLELHDSTNHKYLIKFLPGLFGQHEAVVVLPSKEELSLSRILE